MIFDIFYNFSFGATKSSFAMLGMSAGINSSPTSWEEEMTALVGEQLSTFVKTGLPSGNVPKFNTNGEYIKGKDHSDFCVTPGNAMAAYKIKFSTVSSPEFTQSDFIIGFSVVRYCDFR